MCSSSLFTKSTKTMTSSTMGPHVMFLAVTLLAVRTEARTAACNIARCQCHNNRLWLYQDVRCFVSSITPSDATITALSTDVKSLELQCGSLKYLSFLSDGIFYKFNQLLTLQIKKCNISVLTMDSFRGLNSLQNLLIDDSILPSLGSHTFVHLGGLKSLNIEYCNLTFLPSISHLQSLQLLNVSHNNLRQIELEAFVDTENKTHAGYLNNLIIVDISYNNISSTPLDLFTKAPRLVMLFLMGLPLTELSIPWNLPFLQVLDATHTPLAAVDISGLRSTTAMATLHLEGTGQPLHLPFLSQLVRLEELSLTNFAITDTIWQQLNSSHLAKLTLTNNRLTTIDVGHLPALQLLNVAGNNISHLSGASFINQSPNSTRGASVNTFHKNVNSTILDLDENNISLLKPGVFKGLNKLIELRLRSNFISSLPDTIFRDLTSLRVLDISRNNLTAIPRLSYMTDLQSLTISYNQITSISMSDLSGLINLFSFSIEYNKLTRLSQNLLSPCPKLSMAVFNNNQISQLGTFGAHPSLRGINLENNQITDFPAESPLFRLQKLEYLFLDGNNLTRLDRNMFPLSLQGLSLSKNKLEMLHPTSFNYLPNLTAVYLFDNKKLLTIPSGAVTVFGNRSPKPAFIMGMNYFLCDCHMSYLKVISENSSAVLLSNNPYPKFVGIKYNSCYTPFEGGTIRPFMDVPLSHFACEYNVTWCDDICPCCSDAPKCECALSCPSECKCYYGGSGLKKFYIHIHCRSQNLEQIPNGIPARTVVLYLDGNNFGHLSKQDFVHLQNAEDIYLNSSYIQSADNGTFENISALKSLSLNDNQLTSIDDNFLGRLPSVKQIYLHNNLIDTISSEAFSQLSSVETITLHNNRLMLLKAVLKIPHPMALTLSGNPWSCNCDVSKVLIRTFYEIKASIADNGELCCSFQESSFLGHLESSDRKLLSTNENGTPFESNPIEIMGDKQRHFASENSNSTTSNHSSSCLPLSDFSYPDYCRAAVPDSALSSSTSRLDFHPGFIALIVITIMLLLTAVTVVVVLVKRQEVQAWVFVKLGVRILDEKVHLDKKDDDQKVFDAFISYSSKDEVFVATTLAPLLEENNYRLCVHYRDFPVGRDITETIYRAIQNSSRTILLLSMNFLSSEWCRFEFQTAHHHVLREGSHRLIVVILGDVPEEEMDPDLKVHIQSRTYLKYGDRWFWEKLFFAMPSIKGRQVNNGDQRADILQRMQVLAQDEIVDREINLPGQQHNIQDEFPFVEINLPGQQHNVQGQFPFVEINLPEQQHNIQDEFPFVEINLPGQQHNIQDEFPYVEINLPGQQHNIQDEFPFVEINLPGQQHNIQDEFPFVEINLPGQQYNVQDEFPFVEINLPGQQHNVQDEFPFVEINLPGQQHNPEDNISFAEIKLPGQQHNPQDEIPFIEIDLIGQKYNRPDATNLD